MKKTLNIERLRADRRIVSGTWIVGSVKKDSFNFSASDRPAVHTTRKSAEGEAARLAEFDTSKKFVVLRIEGMASVPQPRPAVRWE